ncbi:hypothetical protein GTO91_16055 [Heliobacterium undosum]|uniref:Uncharacterized protein n=1 Tax=Heliomicrobium undosum TaxID=121734 RepID=A0A845L9B4_9FIRM|nr:transposase family protein [Heliomicrobium undosum]MZP31220.1 hypothetical protein [Heliomicrobium undosum]
MQSVAQPPTKLQVILCRTPGGKKAGRQVQLFTQYASKVHGFSQMVRQAKNGRKQPRIKAPAIFTVAFFGAFFGMESMEQMEHWRKTGTFRQLVPKKVSLPSHDTVRKALTEWDLEEHGSSMTV